MSSKARSLRERMSIDPDAPSPVAERRPRTRSAAPVEAPAPSARPADEERGPEETTARSEVAPPPPEPDRGGGAVREVEPTSRPGATSAAPSTTGVSAPSVRAVPEPTPAAEPTAPEPTAVEPPGAEVAEPTAPTKRSASRSRSTRSASRRTRRSGKDGLDWETALDDPAISAGGNGYRSFYVSDEVFARFRAAVYWTARRPDVDDVPDNMSVGIEDYMDSVATDLERRFNDRTVFPPTPDQVRAHRKRQGSS